MSNQRIDLIRQALGAAESSIKLAKQLLNELEGVPNPGAKNTVENDRPGVIGVYDGEKMVTQKGDVFPVPANYASKSLLVVGDTLKLYEENGEKRFKQIEHVKRHKTNGILVKKDGKFRAITSEGSYKVLPEAIAHFKGDVGDEVVLHVPAGNMTSPYGAIESLSKKVKAAGAEETEDTGNVEEHTQKVEDKKETPVVKAQEEKKKEEPVITKPEEKSKEEKSTGSGISLEPEKKVEVKSEPAPIEVKKEVPVVVQKAEPVKPEAAKTPEPVEAPNPPAPPAGPAGGEKKEPEDKEDKVEAVKIETEVKVEEVKKVEVPVVVAEPVKAQTPETVEEDELS